MPPSLNAFFKALLSQCHPRMLSLLALPFLVSLAVLALVAGFAWDPLSAWVSAHMLEPTSNIGKAYLWASSLGLGGIKEILMISIALLFFTPLAFVLGLAITAAVAMPAVVRFLGSGGYKDIHFEGSFSLAASLINSLIALGVFVLVYFLSLPLWLFPFIGLVVPWLCWSWLTSRIMRFDSLLEHATAAERGVIIGKYRTQYFLLGMMVSALNFFPLMVLITPVLSALAFGHFSLQALRELRATGYKSPIRVS
jgi:Etoposide-induced protein 2.4 (EI24)